jgi:hypothetical protein
MRHDNAMQGRCALQDFVVPTADQPFLIGRAHAAASYPKAGNHVSGDVLVGNKGRVEWPHPVVLRSQTCSPFNTSAAYRKRRRQAILREVRILPRSCSCVAPLAAGSRRNSTLDRVPRTHGLPHRRGPERGSGRGCVGTGPGRGASSAKRRRPLFRAHRSAGSRKR